MQGRLRADTRPDGPATHRAVGSHGHTAAAFHLDRREVPFDLPDMGLSVFRSAAEGDEPGVRWFLERVAAAFRTLDESQ